MSRIRCGRTGTVSRPTQLPGYRVLGWCVPVLYIRFNQSILFRSRLRLAEGGHLCSVPGEPLGNTWFAPAPIYLHQWDYRTSFRNSESSESNQSAGNDRSNRDLQVVTSDAGHIMSASKPLMAQFKGGKREHVLSSYPGVLNIPLGWIIHWGYCWETVVRKVVAPAVCEQKPGPNLAIGTPTSLRVISCMSRGAPSPLRPR